MNLLSYIINNGFIERVVLPSDIRRSQLITRAIKLMDKETEAEDNLILDEPIFLFSAGWGSGSTLLQRLIVSSNEVFIWGEPYDNSCIIQKMASFLEPINNEWPPKKFVESENRQIKYSDMWIANLYPKLNHFKSAQREFFIELFEKPAKKYNVNRWGIKEVRLTIDHARYLKWLFPNAKFVFIYRNLYDCFLSIRNTNWYSYWPKYKIGNPIYYAHYWKTLVRGFRDRYQEVGGLLIEYEKLISGKYDLEKLAAHLNITTIDSEVLKLRLGVRGSGKWLKRRQKVLLKAIGDKEMQSLYDD